jgi:hypothetical protein
MTEKTILCYSKPHASSHIGRLDKAMELLQVFIKKLLEMTLTSNTAMHFIKTETGETFTSFDRLSLKWSGLIDRLG